MALVLISLTHKAGRTSRTIGFFIHGKMENYNNKIQAIIGLQHKGYDLDFVLKDENLLCLQELELIGPDEFEIAETYKFEENHAIAETFVVYAIRSVQRDLKGILMTSYSAFTKGLGFRLWCKLSRTL
jgi:hypothetical protein